MESKWNPNRVKMKIESKWSPNGEKNDPERRNSTGVKKVFYAPHIFTEKGANLG